MTRPVYGENADIFSICEMNIWKEENVSYLDEERHIAELHSSRLRQSLQFRSQADQLGQIHFVAVTKVRNLQSRGHRLDHRFLKTCQCTKSIILNKSHLRSKRIMRISEIKPISVFLNVTCLLQVQCGPCP